MAEHREYLFANRGAAEHERLRTQAMAFDPLTRRALQATGLAPGMRVLDLGSGAGSTAMLAAELVGPDGAVVGIDRDVDAIEHARREVAQAGLDNIEFRQADVQTLEGVETGFDAVIGRFILMYLADPVATLRHAAARVRPGGVVCMHEFDLTYLWAVPSTPLWERARAWLLNTLAKAGAETRLGLSLFALFRAAGLPDPKLMLESCIGGGSQAPAWVYANAIEGALPVMERTGIATREEVEPATLSKRLLAETVTNDGIVIGPPMIAAWTTLRTNMRSDGRTPSGREHAQSRPD